MGNNIYFAIDLKSFYASVECRERNLDPLNANLVVADVSRTDKTICLAVSPSLKKYGIPGRARLFEVKQAIKIINKERLKKAPNHKFIGKSIFDDELMKDPSLELDFVAATPQMNKYMRISGEIYNIYLKYFASEDIHVYSIDEVFIDVTPYLDTYKLNPHDLAKKVIKDILKNTGITATAGIGTNLYLAKAAMDIVAKHVPGDKDGVRVAYLDEKLYREKLWSHKPLKDFWRVGTGYINRLAKYGLYTMGDIARFSLKNEDALYEEFGINAELLIDHAWGYESCTMKDIKGYVPENNSISSGQVLSEPYDAKKGKLIVKEMADLLALDLVKKGLVTDQIALAIGYDVIDLENFNGELKNDYYGRKMPKMAHSSVNLGEFTSSSKVIMKAVSDLYDKIMDKRLHMRRVYICATHVLNEEIAEKESKDYEQLSLFTDYEEMELRKEKHNKEKEEEKLLAETILNIQGKYGKNSLIKGMNLEEGGTTIERNKQVGGHKA
ncbi:MAG: DNA methylase [Bacilli bacterium]|nr:DNA methylase [Bacilli bacterium]